MTDASVEKEKPLSYRILSVVWLPLLIVFVLPIVFAAVLSVMIYWFYLDEKSFIDALRCVTTGLRFLFANPEHPELLFQVLLNSILHGSIYALAGVGLTMTYRILKFANFAHAELVTFGAYVAFILNVEWGGLSPGISLVLGVIFAFFIGGALGIGSDFAVFKRLRDKESAAMSLMVTSIGVGYVIRHLIQQRYGSEPLYYTIPSTACLPDWLGVDWCLKITGPYRILGAAITGLHVIIIITALVTVAVLHLLLTYTTLGKAMRATADNPILAQAAGIHTERIIRVTWFVGAGVAAIGGSLRAADTHLVPILGFSLLLIVFAVVILGGIGSFYGCILAAYIIGLAENIGVTLLLMCGVSTGYRQAMAFIVLIIVLLIKPTGLLGLKEPGVGEE